MRHYYLSRSWLVSLNARKVYRFTAISSQLLIVLPLLIAVLSDDVLARPLIKQLLELALLVAVFSTATTLVAMEYYFFTLDNSGGWSKTFWFLIALFPPIGTALYCFLVYSRSSYFQPTAAGNAQATSA